MGVDDTSGDVTPTSLESPSRPLASNGLRSVRAYGHATLQSGFAFARAGVTCVGAVVGAGFESVGAFAAAHRTSRSDGADAREERRALP